jgi:hypothetical protein
MKRFKKILKAGALVLGLLVALGLAWNAEKVWTTGAQLEERLAALRRAGDPVTLADLERPAPPAGQNAAVILRKAQKDVDELVKELTAIDEKYPAHEGLPSESEQGALAAALGKYPHLLPLLEQAAACPDCNLELAYAGGPHVLQEGLLDKVQKFRGYAWVLRAHAQCLCAQGKRDDALSACLVGLRLSRHAERDPLLIAYLVVLSCRAQAIHDANTILRSGPVSDPLRAELDKELALGDEVHGYQQSLKGERAYAIRAVEDMRLG